MNTYIYDQAWQRERDRLLSLEDLFDSSSKHHLMDLGVGEGWWCLEVGYGAGGVASWLAHRVGNSGQVVATDLDPRFAEGHGRSNLEVRKHDIVIDELEEGRFDLAHARAVLEHIPQRVVALQRIVSAVRPGGWVMIEDFDFGGDAMLSVLTRYIRPAEYGALVKRAGRAFGTLFSVAGADPNFGAQLPDVLIEAGLENVNSEVHIPFVWGGQGRNFFRLSLQHLRSKMVISNLLTDDEVDQLIQVTEKSEYRGVSLPMVTAWGQRPASAR